MGYRGQRKHLKRVAAPKHWMLNKLGGVFAPRPSQGPHKLRECLPMIVFLRNRLGYALTYDEARKICKQRHIKIDGKVRTDFRFPAGFMDIITIDQTNENFRLIYDVKGRFVVHRVSKEEATYKLCKVTRVQTGPKGVPYLDTHDGRTIRYPDPHIKVNDSIKFNIGTSKIDDFITFEVGSMVMITGGNNLGRIGTLVSREKHPGSFEIIHVRDANNHSFATRINYVFVIGKGSKPMISIPVGKGLRLTIDEDRRRKLEKALAGKASKSRPAIDERN